MSAARLEWALENGQVRTIGILTRVAVGFTPGTPTASGEYVVTNANAHAWVEVRFPRLGWIAFEPTPRSDGNVLVPSATSPAPHLLQSQPQDDAAPNDPLRADQEGQTGQDRPLGQGLSPNRHPSGAQADAQPQSPRSSRPSSGIPLGVLLFGLTALTLGGVAGGVRGLRTRVASPTDRALRARARVERIGRGFGVSPLATETDREYRPSHRHRGRTPSPTPTPSAGERLARATAVACYAPTVTEADADDAELAAADLRHHLLDPLPAHRRLATLARGLVVTALRARLERGRRRAR